MTYIRGSGSWWMLELMLISVSNSHSFLPVSLLISNIMVMVLFDELTATNGVLISYIKHISHWKFEPSVVLNKYPTQEYVFSRHWRAHWTVERTSVVLISWHCKGFLSDWSKPHRDLQLLQRGVALLWSATELHPNYPYFWNNIYSYTHLCIKLSFF